MARQGARPAQRGKTARKTTGKLPARKSSSSREPKTRPTGENVERFLATLPDASQREDCLVLLELFRKVTKLEPKLWAGSMVGFGDYHYRYASGHEGDAFCTGFAPRKGSLVIYVLSGYEGQQALLDKLGKHSTGKVCLYIKRLADVHLPTLRKLVQQGFRHGPACGG